MPHRIQQWQSLGCPDHPIPLLSPETSKQILLQVPGLYKDSPDTYNSSYLNISAGY